MTITSSPTRPCAPAPRARLARTAAAATLLSVGVLHAAWGAGSNWPYDDRAELADAVFGASGSRPPSGATSYLVAAALSAAAVAVAGHPQRLDQPRRATVLGIAAGLTVRGALGLTGHTHLVSPASTGERFRRLDRRIYSPLCLTLAALTALSVTDHHRCQ